MPLYDFVCSGCGPFEARIAASAASRGAGCPVCGAFATRVFSAPGGRVPRRQRQLQGLSGPALERVDRAQAGAASVGGLPAGVRVDGGGRPRPHGPGLKNRRPWQLGH